VGSQRSLVLLVTAALLCLGGGCGDDDSGADPEGGADAGRSSDLGPTEDAGPGSDAAIDLGRSPIDAGGDAPDTGPADATATDTEPADAGPGDAEPADAGAIDAQSDRDSGADGGGTADLGYEPDPTLITLHGPCPPGARFGGFKVEANEAEGYTAIDGVVKDSVVQGQIPEQTLTEGGCRLLRRRRLVCEPPCNPGQTCDLGEVCVPSPRGQDMGEVSFAGLAQPVTLEALQPGNTYFYTRLPHPGFTPNVVVHVANHAGFVSPLDLYGIGVPPLVPEEETWILTEGEALELRWDAPPDGARSELYFELNIDQHGLTPVNLVCSLPDTGHAVVPVAATDGLIGAGVTGFPTGRVARRTIDSADFDGRCVELVVSSVRPVAVEVTGHLPCTSHEDCPSGVCDLEIQQCE